MAVEEEIGELGIPEEVEVQDVAEAMGENRLLLCVRRKDRRTVLGQTLRAHVKRAEAVENKPTLLYRA